MALEILWDNSKDDFTILKNENSINPLPPKYSPDDAYGKYRREAKESNWKEKNFL